VKSNIDKNEVDKRRNTIKSVKLSENVILRRKDKDYNYKQLRKRKSNIKKKRINFKI